MKRFFLFVFLWLSVKINVQADQLNISATLVKFYLGNYKAGTTLSIVDLEYDLDDSKLPPTLNFQMILSDGSKLPCTFDFLNKYLKYDIKSVDDLWNSAILQHVIPMLTKNGFQNDLRSEKAQDALEYRFAIENNGLEFYDPYLLNYLYTLISKISPTNFIDKRSGNINVIIMQNPSINAATFPNGTIVINTGLLSALHTEDELVAVLAHEIAHFVLDHQIYNINEQIRAEKRAKIAAGIATTIAAITEGIMVSKDNYYMPGVITTSVAALSIAIANQYAINFGIKYNHKQEFEADQYAQHVLDLLGYDHNALSSALTRIKNIMSQNRSTDMYYACESHPALVSRINKLGQPELKTDVNFERMMSFAITNSAVTNYNTHRFKEALEDVNRNIKNNVAGVDDYLIKANCLLALYDTESSNNTVCDLIKKAKELQSDNLNIYKLEILAELRLKHNQQAINKLKEYSIKLNDTKKELPSILNQTTWQSLYSFIINEQEWVDKMLIKLNALNKQSVK